MRVLVTIEEPGGALVRVSPRERAGTSAIRRSLYDRRLPAARGPRYHDATMREMGNGRGATLPASRAFVVQFAVGLDDDAAFRGRVEHLVSGSVEHFDSLRGLEEFVKHVLGSAAGAPSQTKGDQR
jgi:hypothetical protein